MNILDKIVASTRERVEREKAAGLPPMCKKTRTPFAFEQALRNPNAGGIAFICEAKKASPSKGVIAESFPYVEIAKEYEAAGADAMSVLTEPEFFKGSNQYLAEIREAVEMPLLRKDFVVDAFQIKQAACLGANAVLLICSILSAQQLAEYMKEAEELGLSALVETHNEAELEMALAAGARIIGANNRDLKTFEVDFNNSIRLKKLAPKEVLFVAESGVRTAADVEVLRSNGIGAVLVGETLMRAADKKAALDELRGGKR